MNPRSKIAGWCGVLAGAGLAAESALWTISGWSPDTFANPEAALAFLAEGGDVLRWAVACGFVNLVFFVLLVTGLAGRLRATHPTLAAGTLWFGMIGTATHVLVPMSHWYGVPAFLRATAADPAAAEPAWTAFVIVGHEAAGGAGSLFMGMSMLLAGCALVRSRSRGNDSMPRGSAALGYLGVLAGTATVLTLLAPDTPLSALAGALFMPSLGLSIVFRIWAGLALVCADRLPDLRAGHDSKHGRSIENAHRDVSR